MPEAMTYLGPDDVTRQNPFDSSTVERAERDRNYQRAWDYYTGKHRKFLKLKEGEPDDNVVMNLVKMTAERTVSFLFPTMPRFELGPVDSTVQKEEKWIYDLIDYNGGLSFLHRIALTGFLSGHVHIRVRPPEAPNMEFPKLSILHPGRTVTYWKADDVDTVVWHEYSWKVGRAYYLLDFINDRENQRWLIRQYVKDGSTAWVMTDEAVWPSMYGPIVHWQHLPNPNYFYGASEVQDLNLQDNINLMASEMVRILRYHASPRTVAFGVEREDIQETAIDHMWSIESTDARVENLEMESQLEAGRNLLGTFYDTYLANSRVVLLRGEVRDFQRVTNAGVRTIFMDSLSKRDVLADQYVTGLTNVIYRAGQVMNKEIIPNVILNDPLPVDEGERTRVQQLRLAMGVTARKEIVEGEGRSWERVRAEIKEEAEDPAFIPKDPNQVQTRDLTKSDVIV